MDRINRRRFVKNLASVMATMTTGAGLQSCSTVRASYKRSKKQVDVPFVLTRLDSINKKIANDEKLNLASDMYQQSGCSPYLLQESLISLLTVGAFGDLPKGDRQHPAMQKRMYETAPLMGRSVLGMATFLENLSPRERRRVQKSLRKNPETMRSFQAEFDAAGRREHVPSVRLDHFNALLNQCSWRLEKQDPSLLIDEIVKSVDKTGMQYGISPEDRRMMSQAWSRERNSAFARPVSYSGNSPLKGSEQVESENSVDDDIAEDNTVEPEYPDTSVNQLNESSQAGTTLDSIPSLMEETIRDEIADTVNASKIITKTGDTVHPVDKSKYRRDELDSLRTHNPEAYAVYLQEKGQHLVNVGLAWMGIGVLAAGTGGIMMAADDDVLGTAWSIGVGFGVTGGGICFLTGIIITAIGGAKSARARRLLTEEADSTEKKIIKKSLEDDNLNKRVKDLETQVDSIGENLERNIEDEEEDD